MVMTSRRLQRFVQSRGSSGSSSEDYAWDPSCHWNVFEQQRPGAAVSFSATLRRSSSYIWNYSYEEQGLFPQSSQDNHHLKLLLLLLLLLRIILLLLCISSTDYTPTAQDIVFDFRAPGPRKWETPTSPATSRQRHRQPHQGYEGNQVV